MQQMQQCIKGGHWSDQMALLPQHGASMLFVFAAHTFD